MAQHARLLTFTDTHPDLLMQAQHQREYWKRVFPPVKLVRIDEDTTLVDDLYGEALDWELQPGVEINAHVEHSPSVQRLKKIGITEEREVVFSFSTLLLDDAGLLEDNSQFLIGALVQFDEDLYELLTQHRAKDGYWLQTNIPFYFECTADRYQRGK